NMIHWSIVLPSQVPFQKSLDEDVSEFPKVIRLVNELQAESIKLTKVSFKAESIQGEKSNPMTITIEGRLALGLMKHLLLGFNENSKFRDYDTFSNPAQNSNDSKIFMDEIKETRDNFAFDTFKYLVE